MTKILRYFLLSLVLSSLACTLGGLLPTEGTQPTAEVPSSPLETTPFPPEEEQETPSPQPTTAEPTASPTAQATLPLPTGQCQNEFYPVVQGATWQYQMSGVSSDTFVRSITAVREDGFDDQDVFGMGTVRQGSWACRAGDLIALTPGGGAFVSAGTMQTNFTVESNQGISLPANPQLGQGWSQAIAYRGQSEMGGTSFKTRTFLERSCVAANFERVRVPAGEFEALRVDCSTKIDFSISDMSTFSVSETGSVWYASGVGMVKSSSSDQAANIEIVLLTYNIP
ncbi:MAG: hypothetical protein RML93_09835 [Anaerolineales bacterium]|nr:hypothetical protein [Anaerolineales bacterium]MCS7247653.1 hypothetical protein [Anaerolineales bacterium]MDW8161463.1 hypothetical protein [Anaerolineales bacterium]MDW8447577.1 hypothetical protein [Anaerolineales bacterium]